MPDIELGRFVLYLDELDRTDLVRAGGKAANLGELMQIEGVTVPAGFCVTTDAFVHVLGGVQSIAERLERLDLLTRYDGEAMGSLGAEIRQAIRSITMPDDLAAEVTRALTHLGDEVAYAVRSSATAEDLPMASFAGQYDSYLNVVGTPTILDHVSRCWASLFTARAIAYRIHHDIDHRRVHMAVVVQRLVEADASGVVFTADPSTSNRTVTSVGATFGLGEALVSGRVDSDVYRVRNDRIIERAVAAKHRTIHTSPAGGTREEPIGPERRTQAALSDAQILELARIGHRIESHFGSPQDVEWCLAAGRFQIVQTRSITTLFPIPAAGDDKNHVYISVGHQQMMTEPMKPLGLSMWQLTTPAPMAEAAGRLFVDVTARLSSPESRPQLLDMLGRSDPLMRDALETVIDRNDFLPAWDGTPVQPLPAGTSKPIEADPAIVTELIEQNQASVEELELDIRTKTGTELFEFILQDLHVLRQLLRQGLEVIMTAMEATWWLNDRLAEWLGDKTAADPLTRSAPNDVTAQMGLALLDVADAIRPHSDVVAHLERLDSDDFLAQLDRLDGGPEARRAIEAFLDRYGMRCLGEIDITRPRWAERPSALVPTILANIRNFEAGASALRFEQGRQAAAEAERRILDRLRTLPDGARKAEETEKRIGLVRTFIGYREYPKYGMIRRYFTYKRALLREAEQLASAGVLRNTDDVFYLTFDEFRQVVHTQVVDQGLIDERREAHRWHGVLVPPRVLTSDGEAISGAYRRNDVPPGALVGLPVSAGIIEGRARVISSMAEADLEPGDILVTTHTDPSWSPLFVTIGGLVTEVGGLMTHGSVVAREYGLPAVVGVEHATAQIPDGRLIRVDGGAGIVEILDTQAPSHQAGL